MTTRYKLSQHIVIVGPHQLIVPASPPYQEPPAPDPPYYPPPVHMFPDVNFLSDFVEPPSLRKGTP